MAAMGMKKTFLLLPARTGLALEAVKRVLRGWLMLS